MLDSADGSTKHRSGEASRQKHVPRRSRSELPLSEEVKVLSLRNEKEKRAALKVLRCIVRTELTHKVVRHRYFS